MAFFATKWGGGVRNCRKFLFLRERRKAKKGVTHVAVPHLKTKGRKIT
jgi:hypothetical protein